MSKILEMRQKRAEVWDKARAFLDERTNENGVMTAEDSQQYERMEREVVDLGHTIDRMERAEQMDREMNGAPRLKIRILRCNMWSIPAPLRKRPFRMIVRQVIVPIST